MLERLFLLSEMCGGVIIATLKALRKMLDGFKSHRAGYLSYRKVSRLEQFQRLKHSCVHHVLVKRLSGVCKHTAVDIIGMVIKVQADRSV